MAKEKTIKGGRRFKQACRLITRDYEKNEGLMTQEESN